MKTDKLIDAYFNWYHEENNDPHGELEWLIKCALNGKNKDEVTEALLTVYKHKTNNYENN